MLRFGDSKSIDCINNQYLPSRLSIEILTVQTSARKITVVAPYEYRTAPSLPPWQPLTPMIQPTPAPTAA